MVEQSTDDRIIEAALGLVAEAGLGGVTMVGVAEAAGISRQTLYNHYSDVDGIVVAAIRRHNEISIQLLESSLRVVDDPSAKLEQLVRHAVSIGAHAHGARGMEHALSTAARATLDDYHEALDGSIRSILSDGRDAGVFRSDIDVDIDATIVRHMLDGLAEHAARTPDHAAGLATTGTRTLLAAVLA